MLYITRFPVAPQKYTEQQQTDAFLQCRTRWLGIFFSFFAAKFKIDAPKENQFTTRWILKAFLPHEMSNLHRDAEGYSKKKKIIFSYVLLENNNVRDVLEFHREGNERCQEHQFKH